jgi:hypothetical protein
MEEGTEFLHRIKNGGKLVPQGLIHSRIALHDDIPVHTPAIAVFLLWQAGERHGSVDLLIFFG